MAYSDNNQCLVLESFLELGQRYGSPVASTVSFISILHGIPRNRGRFKSHNSVEMSFALVMVQFVAFDCCYPTPVHES